MYRTCPEHPAVAAAERTGYPELQEDEVCCICGAPANVWGYTSGYKCFDCARREFEELSDEEAAEILGFEVLE